MTFSHLTLLDLLSSMSHMSDWKITKGPSKSHIENTNPVINYDSVRGVDR